MIYLEEYDYCIRVEDDVHHAKSNTPTVMEMPKCAKQGCNKICRPGYDKCVSHGGGKRCVEPGCTKAAVPRRNADGISVYKCVKHGGGKRCVEPGCTKGAQGPSDKCIKHGGGRRCVEPGCTKGAKFRNNTCQLHNKQILSPKT